MIWSILAAQVRFDTPTDVRRVVASIHRRHLYFFGTRLALSPTLALPLPLLSDASALPSLFAQVLIKRSPPPSAFKASPTSSSPQPHRVPSLPTSTMDDLPPHLPISVPPTLHLSPASILITDVDEEVRLPPPPRASLTTSLNHQIFLLYTQKASYEAQLSSNSSAGLGFVETKTDVLDVVLTITPPTSSLLPSSMRTKGKGKKKEGKKEVVVCVKVQQDLGALRNRKGDTGTVLSPSQSVSPVLMSMCA